ncbi:expressed protein [Phakopsora pachyrhizi]|uniref:Expressed protein n=1 Tax=Phakopsora pachyrhizi TaxID=170000 RepID=A0AAV0BJ23_PHAPC|nr:expressed protein [Phakopsora pachyrhizi]
MTHLMLIIFTAFALATTFNAVVSVVVKHSGQTIRKPIRMKSSNQRVDSLISFNHLKRDPSSTLVQKKTNSEKLFQVLQRRSEEHSQSFSDGNNFMMITTTEIPDSQSIQTISTSERPGDESIRVEMMIIGVEDPQEKTVRKISRPFGSNGPLFIKESPKMTGRPRESHLEMGFNPNFFNEEEFSDGIQAALENILMMGGSNESPLRLKNLIHQAKEASTVTDTHSLKPPASTFTMQAEKPQKSYPKPQNQVESTSKPSKQATTNPASFSQAQNKQIFLGQKNTFDNTSHHSQL